MHTLYIYVCVWERLYYDHMVVCLYCVLLNMLMDSLFIITLYILLSTLKLI